MGQTNRPSNLLDRIKRVERELGRVWKSIGLSSATIAQGGLSLIQDAYFRMKDSSDKERVYIGNLDYGGGVQSVFIVRDQFETVRVGIYDPALGDGYQPVFWLFDHLGQICITTDKNGGLAEPWLHVPMYPKFFTNSFLDSANTDPTLPVSAITSEGTVWEGRIGKVSHPRIQYDMVGGRVTGASGSPTYRFYVGGDLLDTWSNTGYTSYLRGPFDIADQIGDSNVQVRLTVQATGTAIDRVAIGMLGTTLRQT